MSRYAFIAAAALFAALMLVLSLALAQRDARFSHSLVEPHPDYADQLVSPIAVHKEAIETFEAPALRSDDNSQTQYASYTTPFGDEGGALPLQSPPKRILAEPPRFDASRIVSRRGTEPVEGPKLLTSVPSVPATSLPSTAPPVSSGISNSGLTSVSVPGAPLTESSSTRSSSTRLTDDAASSESREPFSSTPFPALPIASEVPGNNAPLPKTMSVAAPPTTTLPTTTPIGAPPIGAPPMGAPPMATLGAPRPTNSPENFSGKDPLPVTNSNAANSSFPATNTSPNFPSPNFPAPSVSAPMPSARSTLTPELQASPGPRGSVPETRKGTWSLSSGAPGSRQFDGSQNPSLEIHKRAPSEVQVGIPATFTAIVRNVGNATAFEVQVLDAIPRGAKLIRTNPEADPFGNDGLVWNLGELAAGQETSISMELVPESEGEIGSVASVKFAAQASVRTMSTLPKLSVKQVAPGEVLGGESLTILIEVTNTGTGTARDVQLEEDVPASLRHATGAKTLGLAVGDLAPGESQRFEIEFNAIDAGRSANVVRATAQNATTNESSLPIEVKAPKLQLQVVGPRIRYLERPASFEAIVENLGTAVARDLYIVAYLPRGLQFNSATNEGTYLPDQHAIAWNLAELAAGTRAKTEFTLLPVEEGRFVLRMTSDAEGLRAESMEREVYVEGQSELTFEIDDDHDPIETNEITTYTVQINNIGTRPDQDVQLVLEMPEGSVLDQASAPMKYQVQGRSIVFAPMPTMGPKERILVKVAVRHVREGTQILRASLKSGLRSVPVLKDESTQVYVDR